MCVCVCVYLGQHESGRESGIQSRWSPNLFTGIWVEEHTFVKVPICQHVHLILPVQSSPEREGGNSDSSPHIQTRVCDMCAHKNYFSCYTIFEEKSIGSACAVYALLVAVEIGGTDHVDKGSIN